MFHPTEHSHSLDRVIRVGMVALALLCVGAGLGFFLVVLMLLLVP